MSVGLKEFWIKLRKRSEDPARLRYRSQGWFAAGSVFLAWVLIRAIVAWREPTSADDAVRFAVALLFLIEAFHCRATARIYERIIALEKSHEESRRSLPEKP
jgi:hypothetical protein